MTAEQIQAIWPILVMIFIIIIWAVRLESKVKNLEMLQAVESKEFKENLKLVWSKIDDLNKNIQEVLIRVIELKAQYNNNNKGE